MKDKSVRESLLELKEVQLQSEDTVPSPKKIKPPEPTEKIE